MNAPRKKLGLTTRILIGMGLGLAVGLVLNFANTMNATVASGQTVVLEAGFEPHLAMEPGEAQGPGGNVSYEWNVPDTSMFTPQQLRGRTLTIEDFDREQSGRYSVTATVGGNSRSSEPIDLQARPNGGDSDGLVAGSDEPRTIELPALGWSDTYLTDGVFLVVGDIFVRALKFLVVPLVLVSLVCGTAALGDTRRLGRIGMKTVLLYLGTTAIAITLAMSAALLFKPGAGFNPPGNAQFEERSSQPLTQVLIDIFPANPFQAMAEGEMLQVIVFAILFGLAMLMSGAPGRRVLALFEDLNVIILRLVLILIGLAPYGVFCLIAQTFATEGLTAIQPLAGYFGLVLSVLLLHALITYPVLLSILGRLNPLWFIRKMREAQLFAFSTASSNATIPVTLRTVEHKLGVKNSVASFTVPLWATINMDGTAIMQGVATVFIAQAYGIDLGAGELLQVVLTATLASIGTAGVPGVGLIMLSMVLVQVGLPVDGIALIIGIDRLLDMVRTAVNITGDAAVSCIVARSENEFDQDTFDADTSDVDATSIPASPVSASPEAPVSAAKAEGQPGDADRYPRFSYRFPRKSDFE